MIRSTYKTYDNTKFIWMIDIDSYKAFRHGSRLPVEDNVLELMLKQEKK